MSGQPDPVSTILEQLGREAGDDASLTSLVPRVYDELRQLAGCFLADERPDHTLQATALVHEAYVRLSRSTLRPQDRGHFFRLAAMTMRHILIDHARKRAAAKRGSGERGAPLTDTALLIGEPDGDILEIDDALRRLAALSPERARVVELRFYGGCTIAQTAEALDISTATVERHWRFARAWLKAQLGSDEQSRG